jgi:hypothetical protein
MCVVLTASPYLPSLATLAVVTWAHLSIFVAMTAVMSRACSMRTMHGMLCSLLKAKGFITTGTRCQVPLLGYNIMFWDCQELQSGTPEKSGHFFFFFDPRTN